MDFGKRVKGFLGLTGNPRPNLPGNDGCSGSEKIPHPTTPPKTGTPPAAKGFVPHPVLRFCFIPVIVLTVCMALVSNYERHPDERQHLEAGKFYVNHFLPPVIGDESVRQSYHASGISYLNYHWVEYFLMGKVMFFLSFLNNPLLVARFFQVFLLSLLTVWFWYRARGNPSVFIIPCLLLITPQTWYVFSYVNNDAFALFISLLIASALANPKSFCPKALMNPRNVRGYVRSLSLGLLFGILITCKTNYWTFVLFAALWLVINSPFNVQELRKYAVIGLVAILFVGFRVGLDFYVNGETNFVGLSYVNYIRGNFQKKRNKLLAYQEEVANFPYKPSTLEHDLMHSHSGLKLKAKGVSFGELFTKRDWHLTSFSSLVGVYGYMSIFAAKQYYAFMLILYSLFGAYLTFVIARTKDTQSIKQLLLTIVGIALTVFLSAYLSWTHDFQAQGRYLFPAIGMVGLLISANRTHLHKLVVHAFILIAFLLSIYSFVFVALPRIN